jgi:hypothetical protein
MWRPLFLSMDVLHDDHGGGGGGPAAPGGGGPANGSVETCLLFKRIATRVFWGFFGLVWLSFGLMNFSKASSILY